MGSLASIHHHVVLKLKVCVDRTAVWFCCDVHLYNAHVTTQCAFISITVGDYEHSFIAPPSPQN